MKRQQASCDMLYNTFLSIFGRPHQSDQTEIHGELEEIASPVQFLMRRHSSESKDLTVSDNKIFIRGWEALDCCCYYKYEVPAELRVLIREYLSTGRVDDTNIHKATRLWCTIERRADAMLLYGHISDWDTSAVTDMSSLFEDQTGFNDNISHWDVSSVTTMAFMFVEASAFNQSLNLWDVSKVSPHNCHRFLYVI